MVALGKDDVIPLAPLRARRARRAPAPVAFAPLAFVRGDTLPEDTEYRDTGCSLAPSCLSCPLPQCRHDEPRSARRLGNHARDREIALLRRRHAAPIEALAATYGLTARQVYRILQRATEDDRAAVEERKMRSIR
jgi:hypothetical protein